MRFNGLVAFIFLILQVINPFIALVLVGPVMGLMALILSVPITGLLDYSSDTFFPIGLGTAGFIIHVIYLEIAFRIKKGYYAKEAIASLIVVLLIVIALNSGGGGFGLNWRYFLETVYITAIIELVVFYIIRRRFLVKNK